MFILVSLTYVDDCVIFSHRQEKITSLIESINNGPKHYMLANKGDISNHLGFSIKKNPDGTLELSQSHLAEKIINHVGLEVSASLKTRYMPARKSLLQKYESSLGRKCVWNYRAAIVILSYFQE